MWFNETGSRKVFRWNGWRERPLRPDVFFPGAIIPAGRHLFVLERNHFLPGHESIARIDLATESIERTFADTRRHLTMMLDLEGLPWIAAPEAWADQVLLVDKATNRLAAVLPVPGTPVAIARLGRCLVAFAQEARQASFFDLRAEGFPLVARWDLAGLGDDFDVGLQPEQRRERAAHHRLVFGEDAVTPHSGSLRAVSDVVVRAWNSEGREFAFTHDLVWTNDLIGKERIIHAEATVSRLDDNAMIVIVRDISERVRVFDFKPNFPTIMVTLASDARHRRRLTMRADEGVSGRVS
jgi:hypothetical protein